MKTINYTSNSYGASIKIDNDGNSGNNIILPILNKDVVDRIIADNELVIYSDNPPTVNVKVDIYKSAKFPGSYVKITEKIETGEFRLSFYGRIFVNTFIALDIPKGYDFDIRNRSGNFKKNINVVCGLIDNPYTGEMGLQLSTYYNEYTEIEFETSISQIVIKKVYNNRSFNFLHFDDFIRLNSVLKKAIKRGANGFGSTGKK